MISTSKRCSQDTPRAESLAPGTVLTRCMIGFSLSLLDFPRKLIEKCDIFRTSTRTLLFWHPCYGGRDQWNAPKGAISTGRASGSKDIDLLHILYLKIYEHHQYIVLRLNLSQFSNTASCKFMNKNNEMFKNEGIESVAAFQYTSKLPKFRQMSVKGNGFLDGDH